MGATRQWWAQRASASPGAAAASRAVPPAPNANLFVFCTQIQSVFQRARIPRLAHTWRSHAHQFALAKSTASWHPKATRERGGVHSAGVADRVRYGGGGVLAVGQLLVAGAGGHPGGRLTRGGGRVHARVAPAVRGVPRGLAVARAAAARAAAGACACAAARRPSLLPRRLPATPVRQEDPEPSFLTGSLAALLSHT
ncbi:hypothetical protein MSG28_004100 [Choristoneura fumiferana]|uniref:Uncharacterized protein n=1 Tax=Choristoneura fumiferana TaxID=7141 RepID=A0ACC0KIK2_CHOFU|nr:hypothetical protein MSG28_004100 [Choristoneura fumiferana]